MYDMNGALTHTYTQRTVNEIVSEKWKQKKRKTNDEVAYRIHVKEERRQCLLFSVKCTRR